ncbi:MAG: hypothetical protein LC774_11740 [Acidobacteria bacterium]|nr:hypothetical protein [Acidobacteriota bacterium]
MKLVMAILLLLACCGREAFACSCLPVGDDHYPDPVKRIKGDTSDTIFLGKVIRIEEDKHAAYDPEAMLSVAFSIERVWADSRPSAEDYSSITIRTSNNDGMCGFHFKVGGRYFVFAKSLTTYLCTPTDEYDEKTAPEYFKALGKGSEPKKPAAQDPPVKKN